MPGPHVLPFESVLGFPEHFTGVRGNSGHLLSIWTKEVKPTPEQKQIRQKEMETGLRFKEDRYRQEEVRRKEKADLERESGPAGKITDHAQDIPEHIPADQARWHRFHSIRSFRHRAFPTCKPDFLRANARWHAIILEGGFDDDGRFLFRTIHDAKKLTEAFRCAVLKLLLSRL